VLDLISEKETERDVMISSPFRKVRITKKKKASSVNGSGVCGSIKKNRREASGKAAKIVRNAQKGTSTKERPSPKERKNHLRKKTPSFFECAEEQRLLPEGEGREKGGKEGLRWENLPVQEGGGKRKDCVTLYLKLQRWGKGRKGDRETEKAKYGRIEGEGSLNKKRGRGGEECAYSIF